MAEMKFAILGPSSSGKTTLLACMNEALQHAIPGMFSVASNDTFLLLNEAYTSLSNMANKPGLQEFPAVIEGNLKLQEFLFKIKNGINSVKIRFYDYPGGWMIPARKGDDAQKSQNDQVIGMLKESAVIIVAINAPCLIEENGRFEDAGCPSRAINYVLSSALERDIGTRLILFVPIKCEKYLQTPEARFLLEQKIEQAFEPILRLDDNPAYKGKFAMAMLPVQTVGNVQFARFETDPRNSNYYREIYGKTGGNFAPVHADQPMRYLMSFLLKRFQENRGFLGHVRNFLAKVAWFIAPTIFDIDVTLYTWLSDVESETAAEFIRGGIIDPQKIQGTGFKIFCGRGLIGFPT